jgi:hypothetical protein
MCHPPRQGRFGNHAAMQPAMRTGIVLLACLFFGALPGFSEGYLPLIGPAPLRFLAEPAPTPVATVRPSLSPPVPAETPVVVTFEDDEELDWADLPGTGTNSPPPIVLSSPMVLGGDTNAISALSVPPSNELVTPQVLLHYFHQRFGEHHDSASAEVAVPLMFIPPQSSSRPPSKAVYSSP